MKTLYAAVVFMALHLTHTLASAAEVPDGRKMTGLDFLIVQAALSAVREKAFQINIREYRITIVEHEADFYVVAFDPLDKPQTQFGSMPGKPSLEVTLSKADLKIVESRWAR